MTTPGLPGLPGAPEESNPPARRDKAGPLDSPNSLGPLVPTGAEAAAFDRWAQDRGGIPGAVLMEAAGRAAADAIDRLHPSGRVVALVGDGNNGGDALVVLRTLCGRGREVCAVFVGDRASDDPLLHGWPVRVVRDGDLGGDLEGDRWDAVLSGATALIDGVLGTGLTGAPRPRQTTAIRAANRARLPIVSLDVPSGVDPNSGVVAGEAITADVTLAFGWVKLGTLLQPGRSHAGRIVALEIGFPPIPPSESFGQSVISAGWVASALPRRDVVTHKGRSGTLTLVAGGPDMAGAAVIAASAAVRSGAGLVRVASWPENRSVLQAAVPEAIFVNALDPAALSEALDGADAVAVGPGLGTSADAEQVANQVFAGPPQPLVVDADALNLIAAQRAPTIAALAERRPLVLTPHPGEMRRLLGAEAADPAGPARVSIARDAASRWGAVVVLKGSPSIVADPGGHVRVDLLGSSALATAGMGDALTGVIGGMLAQGVASVDGAALALHLSGTAAQAAGAAPGLTPMAIIARLPDAVRGGHVAPPPPEWPGILLDVTPVP